MKSFQIVAIVACLALVSAAEPDSCQVNAEEGCRGSNDDLISCNATFSGFASHADQLQAYANAQLSKSYDYMLLATNFGSYVHNRPGFEKQFLALSQKAWDNTIDLIKHITKRGGSHSFTQRKAVAEPRRVLELNELEALALALDTEKELSLEAHRLHEEYSRHHVSRKGDAVQMRQYDPEVAHFLEEKFIEDQAHTIRKLSGYTNDLKRLIKETTTTSPPSLSVFLFDEYLASQ